MTSKAVGQRKHHKPEKATREEPFREPVAYRLKEKDESGNPSIVTAVAVWGTNAKTFTNIATHSLDGYVERVRQGATGPVDLAEVRARALELPEIPTDLDQRMRNKR